MHRHLTVGTVAFLAWSGAAFAQDVELEVIATEPEYSAQDGAIWSIYEQENPGVTVKMMSINEDTESAYQARVAGGDPADIRSNIFFPTKDNYQTYYDVTDMDCVQWDLFSYDAQNAFRQTHGIDHQPHESTAAKNKSGIPF